MINTRKEGKELTRQRLIESALKLIKENGLSSLTMNQISQRAGIAQPSFYNHYGSLSDLLTEVRAILAERYIVAAKQRFLSLLHGYELGERTIEEVIQKIFRHIVDVMLQDVQIYRAVVADNYDKSSPTNGELGLLLDELNAQWSEFLQNLARRYQVTLQAQQINLYVDSISALVHQLVFGCNQQRYSKTQTVEVLSNFALSLLVAKK